MKNIKLFPLNSTPFPLISWFRISCSRRLQLSSPVKDADVLDTEPQITSLPRHPRNSAAHVVESKGSEWQHSDGRTQSVSKHKKDVECVVTFLLSAFIP